MPLAEVKTEGCASLRCPGLYLSGEVLDAAGAVSYTHLDVYKRQAQGRVQRTHAATQAATLGSLYRIS